MDELFALSPAHHRRLGRSWINYIDDWALRSGRWLDGRCLTDAKYAEERAAAREPPATPYTLGERWMQPASVRQQLRLSSFNDRLRNRYVPR